MSKNKYTGFVSWGQVNELANNAVNKMVREVNVCCLFFNVVEEHKKMKAVLKYAAVLPCLSCCSLQFMWYGVGY